MAQTLRSLFIDFDAWFASIEQALDSSLRGQPVAVVPVMTDQTCCIATSYEAKQLGIKTGTSVWEAKKICPNLKLALSDTARYVYYHQQMLKAIDRCIPIDKVISIDEMACDLTGLWQQPEVAVGIAEQIKVAISEVLNVTCSIGIAPNRFLAKMASKLDKPNGIRVLTASDLPSAFEHIELQDITGIGHSMSRRLERAGITSINQLYAARPEVLRGIWGGIEGERIYAELRGHSAHRPVTQRRSVGHSHVLPPEMRRPDKALAILHKMLQKAAFRMREMGYHAGGMSLNLRLIRNAKNKQRHGWGEYGRFAPVSDTRDLIYVLRALWEHRPKRETIMAVGVQLHDLIADNAVSGELFPRRNHHPEMAEGNLSVIADQINKRFGAQSVFFGGAKEGLQSAPMRIAFTQIPNLELESDGPEQSRRIRKLKAKKLSTDYTDYY